MFNEFTLISINTIAAEKRIDLLFNYDIDAKSIQGDSIILSEMDNDSHIPFTIKVKNDQISLNLKEWPKPNVIYNIIVNTNFTNIIGKTLKSSIRRKIIFKSEITSKVNILSPHNFELLQDIAFKIEEIPTKTKILNAQNQEVEVEIKTNKYYLEIATENVFYNVLHSLVFDADETVNFNLFDMASGQYYIRVRAQSDVNNYGPWSDVVTFIYKTAIQYEPPAVDDSNTDKSMPSAWSDLYDSKQEILDASILNDTKSLPRIQEDLELITFPENGTTPTDGKFILEFNRSLNADSINSIVVIRKDF